MASAKPRAKKGAEPVEDWSPYDQTCAGQQGWGVYECIDSGTVKVFFEILSHGPRFGQTDPDGKARVFVANQSKAGDELAIKAIRAVYRSKAGFTSRRK
jgi:hypothetical protein